MCLSVSGLTLLLDNLITWRIEVEGWNFLRCLSKTCYFEGRFFVQFNYPNHPPSNLSPYLTNPKISTLSFWSDLVKTWSWSQGSRAKLKSRIVFFIQPHQPPQLPKPTILQPTRKHYLWWITIRQFDSSWVESRWVKSNWIESSQVQLSQFKTSYVTLRRDMWSRIT